VKLSIYIVAIAMILPGCTKEETAYRSEIYRKSGENSYTKWDIPAKPEISGPFVCWEEGDTKAKRQCVSGELTVITYPIK